MVPKMGVAPYLVPFACVTCRTSFKRPIVGGGSWERPCPRCRGSAVALSRKFKPPRRTDAEQWDKVALLISHGFRFEPVFEPVVGKKGHFQQVMYPSSLRDTLTWLRRYGRLARCR